MVVEQGDSASHFFFVADGTCKVSIIDHWKQENEIAGELSKGFYFGELAILNECERTATVRSTNYCTFAKIEKEVFKTTCTKFIDNIRNQTLKYEDKL